MENPYGVVLTTFISDSNENIGSLNGLIMSYYDQTVLVTPFDINKHHYTHTKNAVIYVNRIEIRLDESRYSYPFLLRVWKIPSLISGINPSSELTINYPKKNHEIYGTHAKIDKINDMDINFWHLILPPFFGHSIEGEYPIGTITYFNNKPTGMIVKNNRNSSIIVNAFTLKQIVSGLDFYYGGFYYGINIKSDNKTFDVSSDWDQYVNCLKKDDIILSINETPILMQMYYEKLSKELYIDTWITMMFMEKDNNVLDFKIIRNGSYMKISIPRKPLYEIMQIPYYSNDSDKVSFEKIQTHSDSERYKQFGEQLKKEPQRLFM